MNPSLITDASAIAKNGANTILKFIKTNQIPTAITIEVLTELHENPEKYIEQVEIAGKTHYIFARNVMKKMLDLKAEVL